MDLKNDNKNIFTEAIPTISFSPRAPGWKDIFLGILSPNAK